MPPDVETIRAELRKLRAQLQAAEDEAQTLCERLAYAEELIRNLRAKVGAAGQQVGAPIVAATVHSSDEGLTGSAYR